MKDDMQLYGFALTDKGQKRENNEDTFILQYLWDERYVLAAAIDGMGGYEGGEVASAIARTEIVSYLQKYPNGDKIDVLRMAVIQANNAIYQQAMNDSSVCHMGCVLTAVLVDKHTHIAYMAHVGDSRLYKLSDGKLSKISHDMSLVGYREEMGILTEEEAMNHPQRCIIDRAVGLQQLDLSDNEFIESQEFPLSEGDALMLCSDGLCDMITSATMTSILTNDTFSANLGTDANSVALLHDDSESSQNLSAIVEGKVRALVDAANQAGGNDNVTVVLLCVKPKLPDEPSVFPEKPSEGLLDSSDALAELSSQEENSDKPSPVITEVAAQQVVSGPVKPSTGKTRTSLFIVLSIVAAAIVGFIGGFLCKTFIG